VEVYFDDFKIQQSKGSIISAQDYYPFGLTFNTYHQENTLQNLYKYNGKENQDELSLDLDDFGWRMYDSEIGRWPSTDALADSSANLSPFHYVANNPMLNIDPDGQDWFVNQTTGATIYIQGVSVFSYVYLERLLGIELTSKISQGTGADAWQNFGKDDMFDTKDLKLSSKPMIVMDPESSEKFMNAYGYQKAADEVVEEFKNKDSTPEGKEVVFTDWQETKVLSQKVTYAKPDEMKRKRLMIDIETYFGGGITIERYRQVVPYDRRTFPGAKTNSPFDTFRDILNLPKALREAIREDNKRRKK
jgi:RHS repeat-associated protein